MGEEVRDDEGLVIWTIYDHPSDYPRGYIARKFINDEPTFITVTADDINELRHVFSSWGMELISRDLDDDPVIVETWI